MPDIRTSAYAAGQGRQYPPYDGLAPSQKEYIHTTLAYLDLESTPQRRDNLAQALADGTWTHLVQTMREAIDEPGQQLRG